MNLKRGNLVWLWVVVLLTACGLFQGDERVITGSGRVTSETRPVAGIDSVSLEGLGEVVVQQGATEALTIEAEDNLLPLITSEMQGGTLRLGFDRPTWRSTIQPTEPIRYTLTVRDLQAFDLSGTGSLQAGRLQADNFALRITGEGDVSIEQLESSRLAVDISGSGDVSVAGQASGQTVSITGSGDYQAGDLETATTDITISGSGDVVVWAHSDLAMNITGSGTVSYWGDPNISRRDITGAGDINPMGVK